jgi:hypothetical protein
MSDLAQSVNTQPLEPMVAALLKYSTAQIISMMDQYSGPESRAQNAASPDTASLGPVIISCFEDDWENKGIVQSIKSLWLSMFKKGDITENSDEDDFALASNDVIDRINDVFKPTIETLQAQAKKRGVSFPEYLEYLRDDYEAKNMTDDVAGDLPTA